MTDNQDALRERLEQVTGARIAVVEAVEPEREQSAAPVTPEKGALPAAAIMVPITGMGTSVNLADMETAPWRDAENDLIVAAGAEYTGRNVRGAGGKMRVYHLLKKKWALCNLKHRRMKVATFDDLNDPFELRGVKLENRADREHFNSWRKRTAAKLGLLCFSKSWRNPVLWSHYAGEHRGICLGFDVPESCLHKVKYVAQRLEFEQLVPDEDQLQQLLRTKFKDWGYEAEYRRVVCLDKTYEMDNLHFWPFGSDLELREVVLGARCKVQSQNIEDLLGAGFRRIKIVHARPAFQTFKVVKNKRGVT